MAIQTVQGEDKNKRIAAMVSFGLHALLLLGVFFLVRWYPPDPPLPSYGVEVDFGVDNVGSGDIQSLAPANTNPRNDDAKAGNPPTAPEPEVREKPVAPEPEPEEEAPITAPEEAESPLEVKETPKPKEETPKSKKEEKPVEPAPVKEEVPQPKKEEVVNSKALMTKKEGAGGLNNGTSDKIAGNNNGDDVGKVGDKGDPRGIMGSKNYSGTPGNGGSGGAALNMRGWKLDTKLTARDESDETGRIVFQIKVDDQGEIISVTSLEASVSPSVIAFYKKEVYKMSLSPTAENATPPPVSVGTITFDIRSR